MRFFHLFVVFLFCISVNAQLDESIIRRLNEDAPNCWDVSYNAQLIIPEYYNEGKMDSVQGVYAYWEEHCDEGMPLEQLGIFLAIKNRGMNEKEYSKILKSIQYNLIHPNITYIYRSYDQAFVKAQEQFNIFLRKFGRDLLEEENLSPLERDVLNYYVDGSDDLFENLREGKYPNNPLQQGLKTRLQELRYGEEAYFAFYGGAWLPLDNLSELGNHPELGIQAGGYINRYHFALTIGMRFVKAASPYRIIKEDSMYTTDHFFGGYIGLEGSRSVYRDMRNDIKIGAGIAYEGFDIVPSDQEAGIEGVSTGSFNTSVGVGYRYYYDFKNYLELDMRYHFLNYRNNINDDFSGDAITLRLLWGFSSNTEKQRILRNIGY